MTGIEAWVTCVNNSNEALEALVLAQSLRNVFTTKKIVGFVQSNKVDCELRTLLGKAFDTIISTDTCDEILNPDLQNGLQILRFNLCTKCVFLSPSSMVMRNCDELFNEKFPGYWLKKNGEFNSSLFAFRPSNLLWESFQQLIRTAQELQTGHAFDFYIKKWMQNSNQPNAILTKCFTFIGFRDCITRFSKDVKIARLDFPNPLLLANTLEKQSVCEIAGTGVQIFLQAWMDVFCSLDLNTNRLINTSKNLDRIFNIVDPIDAYFNALGSNYAEEILSKTNVHEIESNGTLTTGNIRNDVAVIGMSCKFPGADNLDEFWNLILNGEEAICRVPDGRWDTKEPEFANTFGGFLKSPVDEFDGKFFGISPREAQFIDPQQKLLLEQSWEALENGGINPLSLKGSKTGVFMGMWRNDYEKLILKESNFNDDIMRNYMGNSYAAASARIAFCLGLTGCNVAIDSGCSSSMVSIHLACKSLKEGEIDLAIAGGVNLLLKPYSKKSMEHVFCSDGRCKTFDAKADGFGRAEGCGVLILKTLSNAVRDGDNVLAIIRGSGISQEGTSTSFGAPSSNCQAQSIRDSLLSSAVDPLDVSYVEAHGTGTIKGDPIEMSAICDVYGENRNIPLIIGSVKTNIGHAESAAGVAGIIKTVLAMNKGVIPPHRNLHDLNPLIKLADIPAIIPNTPIDWGRVDNKPRIAGVSSFGISGTNVHVLLQEGDSFKNVRNTNRLFERPLNILTVSAKSKKALDELLHKYETHLHNNPTLDIGNLCFTANTGRANFSHKIAFTAASNSEILDKLRSKAFIKKNENMEGPAKIAFLFPGQGSQYVNMGKLLYDTHPVFKDSMDYSSSLLKPYLGINLLEVIFHDKDELLNESLHSQTAIFCIEYSLLCLWKSFGIKPDLVLGHSLGEFVAAVAAEILSFEEVVKLVYERTELISNLPNGAMLVAKCGHEKIKELLEFFLNGNVNSWIDIACINSPDQIVLSGKKDILDKFAVFCKNQGVKTTVLAANHAYHSRDMDAILPQYLSVASTLNHRPAKCQYVSGMTGNLINDLEFNGQYWVDHCRNSVNYLKAIQTAVDEGCQIFIEIGPQPVLIGLSIQCIPLINLSSGSGMLWMPSMKAKENNWSTLLDSLCHIYVNGGVVDWAGFDFPYQRQKLVLPTYPFQRQKYWLSGKIAKTASNFVGNGNPLHPLVGKRVNLSLPQHIYQNVIDLGELPYLVDHQVAKKIIMPCSGMLEMVLSAGLLTLQNNEKIQTPQFSLIVQDFKINSSFEILKDSGFCFSEIVARSSSDDSFNGFIVTLNKKVINGLEESDWEEFAVGKFTSTASNFGQIENVDLESIKSAKERSSEIVYDKLFEIGLTFGKAFQSIKCIWENESEVLAEVELQETEIQGFNYLCHPILLDSMIQIYVLKCISSGDLYLPIGINKLIWVSRSDCRTYFVRLKVSHANDENDVLLYDDEGKLLVIMQGISVAKTSISSFLNSIDAEKRQMPGLYEEVWRNKCNENGRYSSHLNCEAISNSFLKDRDFLSKMKAVNEVTESHLHFQAAIEKISYLYICKALNNLGWSAKKGDSVDHNEILKVLKIQACHKGLIRRFLEILAEEGILKKNHSVISKCDSDWLVTNELPDNSNIVLQIEGFYKLISEGSDAYGNELGLICTFGNKLDKILQGQQSALDILFPPANKGKFSADKLYSASFAMKQGHSHLDNYLQGLLKCIRDLNSSSLGDFKLRILEIGAGTGGTSSCVLSCLESDGFPYHYTYTDVSQTLISSSKKKFLRFSDYVTFKLLDIEKDPLNQGFAPNQYDIIIASNVLHATSSLKETLKSCRKLLVFGGRILIFETLIPEKKLDLLFGSLPGYWRFEDFELRQRHTLINGNTWKKLLDSNGFSSSFVIETSKFYGLVIAQADELPMTDNFKHFKHWIAVTEENSISGHINKLFKDCNRQISEIQLSDVRKNFKILLNSLSGKTVEGVLYFGNSLQSNSSQKANADEILHVAQCLMMSNNSTLKFVLVTQGAVYIKDQVHANPFDGIYWGFARSFKNENPDISMLFIDLDPNETNEGILAKQLLTEIFSNDGLDYQIAIRDNDRYVLRLVKLDQGLKNLSLPNSDRFKICLPDSKSVMDLNFNADYKSKLAAKEIEVSVRATSLNFRDIFAVMRVMRKDGYTTIAESIGLDFSGVISDIGPEVSNFKKGDPVFGLSFSGALSSHITVPQEYATHKPSNISYSEAAALPAVFCTALYCLEVVAKLTRHDTILIHVAAGGVGLCAVQIAKQIGAKIVATAGSIRKRTYLHSLGIEHVFDSRSTTYGENIMLATGGVDVVLNSLTSLNFKETTLSVCKPNARFVEIGKVGIWEPGEVRLWRPDVAYGIFDLEQVDSRMIQEMILDISNSLKNGKYSPLPSVTFDGRQCRDAFSYFQKARHIGKVVITIPQTKFHLGKMIHWNPLFNEDSTYLITGGLGGIGLEVTKFMAEYGARHIVLVNRNPPSKDALNTIQLLTDSGIKIYCFQVDVGNFAECKKLLITLKDPKFGVPSLRGVMHAAGVISDATIPNQTQEKYDRVFHSKVNGAWNLHLLTQEYNLEHFVMFSSIAAVLAMMGQSNHSAANAYLDALACYRHSLGLAACSINWGAWSEVGAAIKTAVGNEGIQGITPFSPSQGIAALKFLMRQNIVRAASVNIDFKAYKAVYPHRRIYVEEVSANSENKYLETELMDSKKFKQQYDLHSHDKLKLSNFVKLQMEEFIKQILKLNEAETLDENQSFPDMGLDSLMAVEFKNKVQFVLSNNVILSVNTLEDFPTIKSLVGYIVEKYGAAVSQ